MKHNVTAPRPSASIAAVPARAAAAAEISATPGEVITRLFERFAEAMANEGRAVQPAENRPPCSLITTMHGHCRRRPPAGFEPRNVLEAAGCGLQFEPTRRPEPTDTLPRTAERIAVYRRRVELGEQMFDANDYAVGET